MSNYSNDFWNSPAGRTAILNISGGGTNYWQENIYRYFTRHSGKLGRSCQITLDGTRVVASMSPIYSIQHGQLTEYGQSIRHGIPAGPGKYSPIKGYRLKTGQFPGVPTSKFFDPWMAEFEPVLKSIVREEVLSGVRDFVREQLNRGA